MVEQIIKNVLAGPIPKHLKELEERPLAREEYLRRLGAAIPQLMLPGQVGSAIDQIHKSASALAQFEGTLPTGFNRDLALWYHRRPVENPQDREFLNQNHVPLAEFNTRHPNHTDKVFTLNAAGRTHDAGMLLHSTQLPAEAMQELAGLLDTANEAQRQFLGATRFEEWRALSENPQRAVSLMQHVRGGNYAFADVMLATSNLLRDDAASVDAYFEFITPDKFGALSGLAGEIRGGTVQGAAITERLDDISGLAPVRPPEAPPAPPAPPIEPPPVEAPPPQAPEPVGRVIDEDAIINGIQHVEGVVRGHFGELGERAVDGMLSLAMENEGFYNVITTETPDTLRARFTRIIGALRATQTAETPEGQPENPTFQLEFFTRILRNAASRERFEALTNEGRIRAGVELAQSIGRRLVELDPELGGDASHERLMRSVFLTRYPAYVVNTTPAVRGIVERALSDENLADVRRRGLPSSLYIRAIARSPHLGAFLTSTQTLDGIERLAGWQNPVGAPAGLADEYLFQLGSGGEKPFALGNEAALGLLNQMGEIGLYARMGEMSPRVVVNPLLARDAERTEVVLIALAENPDQVKHITAEHFRRLLFTEGGERWEGEVEGRGERSAAELERETIWRIRGEVFVNPRLMMRDITYPSQFRDFNPNVDGRAIRGMNLPYLQERLMMAVSNAPEYTIRVEELESLCRQHPILSVLYAGGRAVIEEDLRNLGNRGLLSNTAVPTIHPNYRLSGQISFEEGGLPWERTHPNVLADRLRERLARIRPYEPETAQRDLEHARQIVNVISNMRDHTIDDRRLLPLVEQRLRVPIFEGRWLLTELVEARVLSPSRIGTHSINQYLLRQIPISYGSHLGADILTRGYSITNFGETRIPAAIFHDAVAADAEERIRNAITEGGRRHVPEQNIRRAVAVARIISNMHMNVCGIAKREHIRRHIVPIEGAPLVTDATDASVITALKTMHDELGLVHRTERGYYALTRNEVGDEERVRVAQQVHTIVDGETGRQPQTRETMHTIVDFVRDHVASLPHTFRRPHLARVWEAVTEEHRDLMLADIPQTPRELASAVESLIRAGVLAPVRDMERGVYQLDPALIRPGYAYP